MTKCCISTLERTKVGVAKRRNKKRKRREGGRKRRATQGVKGGIGSVRSKHDCNEERER